MFLSFFWLLFGNYLMLNGVCWYCSKSILYFRMIEMYLVNKERIIINCYCREYDVVDW